MPQIVLASNNQGKIKEFREIFKNLNIEILPQSEFHVPPVDEPYCTFLENALHKARHCARFTKLPTLADDSGICVKSLDGAPGVFSARYAGNFSNDELNNQKLIQELINIKDRQAYFYCILILIRNENDPQPIIADGIINGEIVDKPFGDNGFGYDPHFYLEKYKKTMAQLSQTEKNQISHRSLAIKALYHKLSNSQII